MPLAAGDRLGPYEILARLGAGGMGEVWKARDTRLGREVAIKTSAEQFTDRFDREARAVAALNHPHICHLHDVGPNYLVMEYIDGRTLEGPLPLPKALDYAAQILDALDAAHSKGITHRDLKPANILVSRQGIKLLDFGLAKRSAPLQETDATQALTEHGQIVGTLNYISPEQLHAKEADARSDIFSFGLVFYEMLTGRRAFEGQSAASVIAAILEREPPSVGEVAPPAIDRVLRRCLAKDPDQRWQSARDLRAALELAGQQQAPVAVRSSRLRRVLGVALALAFASAAALWLLMLRRPPAEERMLQFQIEPPPGADFILGVGGGSAISPDGSMIAFVASAGIPKLWIRRLDSLTPRDLPGTEGALYPFWSPDSRSLGFFANSKLKRVDLAGGPVVSLADAPSNRGGTWNEEGTILFAPVVNGPLMRIPASGGAAVPLASLESARPYVNRRWPEFLPGSRLFLYLVQAGADITGAYLGSLDQPGERPRLVATPEGAHYVPPRGKYPGYLLWLRQGTPTVQVFDPARPQLSGEPVPLPGVGAVTTNGCTFPGLSVSNDGAILLHNGRDLFQMTWFSREGKVLGTADPSGQADEYSTVRIAPDGRHAAADITDPSAFFDIWTIDFARGVKTRVTTGGRGLTMIWSPDSSKVVHYSVNGTSLFMTSATGAGPDDVIYQSSRPLSADDWSRDGRYLVYEELSSENRYNLWLLPMASGDRKPVAYLRTSSNQTNGQVSRDGKWLAYTSDESGQQQVFVNSFPAAGEARWQVSNGGGNYPRWGRDGKELFYRALDGRLMAASVRATAQGLEFGTPAPLFRTIEPLGPHIYPYDVAPDNRRILALVPAGEHNAPLTVLMNWQSKLKPQ